MSTKPTAAEYTLIGVAASLLIMIFGVAACLYFGWAASILWGWFIVPLGAIKLSTLQCTGISLVYYAFRGSVTKTEVAWASVFLGPLMLLLFGWIIKYFM